MTSWSLARRSRHDRQSKHMGSFERSLPASMPPAIYLYVPVGKKKPLLLQGPLFIRTA